MDIFKCRYVTIYEAKIAFFALFIKTALFFPVNGKSGGFLRKIHKIIQKLVEMFLLLIYYKIPKYFEKTTLVISLKKK